MQENKKQKTGRAWRGMCWYQKANMMFRICRKLLSNKEVAVARSSWVLGVAGVLQTSSVQSVHGATLVCGGAAPGWPARASTAAPGGGGRLEVLKHLRHHNEAINSVSRKLYCIPMHTPRF